MLTLRQRYERELSLGPGFCPSCLYWDSPGDVQPCSACTVLERETVPTQWTSCREAVAQLDDEERG